jgi:hypothetical protein
MARGAYPERGSARDLKDKKDMHYQPLVFRTASLSCPG